ncbi:hypothetical protein P171DRAFT_137928 [Karstenula rhodostoma CBS 690.94]|uniref:Uncharacterized protein n=1 Tax=Karstenula rhodostoma CBS 690.94 TaxID=1392251 RepID=A0A9P4PVX4_9PLEO|nr:hypothetical protein P171DRAFT_137928 [Karstenula rhodostoma CBS 690.94]
MQRFLWTAPHQRHQRQMPPPPAQITPSQRPKKPREVCMQGRAQAIFGLQTGERAAGALTTPAAASPPTRSPESPMRSRKKHSDLAPTRCTDYRQALILPRRKVSPLCLPDCCMAKQHRVRLNVGCLSHVEPRATPHGARWGKDKLSWVSLVTSPAPFVHFSASSCITSSASFILLGLDTLDLGNPLTAVAISRQPT